MPSRIPAIRICTCAQSLRSDDVAVCAAEHLGSGQRSRPGKADEDSVFARLSTGCEEGRRGHNVPVRDVVLHWQGCPVRHFQESCMVHRACHGGVLRIAEASVEDSLEAGDPGSGLSREAATHTESRGDRLGSRPQYLDLQALRH